MLDLRGWAGGMSNVDVNEKRGKINFINAPYYIQAKKKKCGFMSILHMQDQLLYVLNSDLSWMA